MFLREFLDHLKDFFHDVGHWHVDSLRGTAHYGPRRPNFISRLCDCCCCSCGGRATSFGPRRPRKLCEFDVWHWPGEMTLITSRVSSATCGKSSFCFTIRSGMVSTTGLSPRSAALAHPRCTPRPLLPLTRTLHPCTRFPVTPSTAYTLYLVTIVTHPSFYHSYTFYRNSFCIRPICCDGYHVARLRHVMVSHPRPPHRSGHKCTMWCPAGTHSCAAESGMTLQSERQLVRACVALRPWWTCGLRGVEHECVSTPFTL